MAAHAERAVTRRGAVGALLLWLFPVWTSSVCAGWATGDSSPPAIASSVAERVPRDALANAVSACSVYALQDAFRPTAAMGAQPLDRRVSWGTVELVRSVRRLLRHSVDVFTFAARWWIDWIVEASAFVVVALLSPLIDRHLYRTWRQRGLQALRVSMTLALAVYVRLLFDARTPAIGKAVLMLAIAYGLAPADLVPDWSRPVGLFDDVAAVALASRCFTRLCPEEVVDDNARIARQVWTQRRTRRQGR